MRACHHWDASGILVSLENTPIRLYEAPYNLKITPFGEVHKGSTLLSLEEAKTLRDTLTEAIANYEGIEAQAKKDLSSD